jgi:hypothetical protein
MIIPDLFVAICEYGDLEYVKKLYYKHTDLIDGYYTVKAFNKSCKNGHLLICKWLYTIEGKFICDIWSLYEACKYGHLHIVQWLLSINKQLLDDDNYDLLLTIAKERDHLAVYEWLNIKN